MTDSRRAVAETFDILGVPITATNVRDAVQRLLAWKADKVGRMVFVRDTASLALVVRDREMIAMHRRADMVTPDGMPLALLGRLKGLQVARTSGADLMKATLVAGQASGVRHYFYGASEEALAGLIEGVATFAPQARIVGAKSPPFQPLESFDVDRLSREFTASGADILWIGISSPKQDLLMARLVDHVDCTMVAVGAAFDFLGGSKHRAPPWMQRVGLEWLHRLATEPRRLWYRYVVLVPRLFVDLAKASLRSRRTPTE